MLPGNDKVKSNGPINCLVTGSTGFLGSSIVDYAMASGVRVRATGQRYSPFSPGIEYCQADILDPGSLPTVMEGMEFVIHTAGLAHVFSGGEKIEPLFKLKNEIGTANVVTASVQAGVRNFLLISSVSVYGPNVSQAADEEYPCHPEGPYAESKYLAERRAIDIALRSGMNLTIFRLATVYGEGDPGNISRLMRKIDQRRFIWIGTGLNQKSLIHREDVARACLAALQKPPRGIHIYNVAGKPCTVKEIVGELGKALDRPVPHWHIPAYFALGLIRIGSRLSRKLGPMDKLKTSIEKWLSTDIYDTSKLEKTFNFKAQINLTEGLRREVSWYRCQKKVHNVEIS